MKKNIFIILVSVFIYTSCNQETEVIDLSTQSKLNNEKENLKVTICHYDEDTGEYHTINVSESAVQAHLDHGDILGDCNDNLICHWKDPEANIWEPMLVKDEDLQEHIDHGDFLGSCGSNPGENFTYIPDENFEQALIDGVKGVPIDSDGVINKRVLTSDIFEVTELQMSGKSISDLTGIKDFKKLRNLNVSNNQLTNIDLSMNTLLVYLIFTNNQIENINLSKNTLLNQLGCYNNELTSLDVSNNPNLNILYCNNNNLTSLDLSNNPNLVRLLCKGNELESLNVKNGFNSKITKFSALNNPDLNFIKVDNPADANAGIAPYDTWGKDTGTSYN